MARLRPRGPYWELAWTERDDETGERKRRSLSLGRRSEVSRDDAKRALEKLQRDLFLEKHGLTTPSSPTVDRWRQDYLAWHAAEFPDSHYRTRQILEQHIPASWALRELGEITDTDVEALKTLWREADYRDHTIAKHLRTVKAWLNRAVEKKLISESPAITVASPRILDSAPPLFYETDELAALYLASSFDAHHPDNSQHADWHAPAWKWLANTGLRRGEALIQKRAWVYSDHLRVLSTGAERTKSGKWREIPLFPGALEGLQALDAILGEREHVLPRVARPSLSRAAAKCIARADLPGSIHTLRHTFGSHLAMDPNVPVRTIQEWMGHASMKTTEIYMHLRRGPPPVQLAL